MGVSSSNVVRLATGNAPSRASSAASQVGSVHQNMSDDLRSLEVLSSNLAVLKGSLIEAIATYSRDCLAAGGTDPTERLTTLLKPVETLEAGMHRLAGAMAATLPR
ncbi:hypothetical protein GOFOIKOB_4013 [Methylobacterium tardum]|uniref:Uncharacterized protein n=2 Tax=Methylobacterium tardum TaxID=374432 RepID=A0AA37TFQ9_9HYPH|nr:hypothetical protein GOFOIKOB_4013 [Methylobacterium tardum]GLS69964.1 hypothetical protein GCM10007890_19770 [Methylobacterium tardum]